MIRLLALVLALAGAAACSFQGGNSAAITATDGGPDDDADTPAGLARFSDEIERFPVPVSGTEGGFYSASSDDGASQWSLLDLDGDGDLDLVQTADPAETLAVFGIDAAPYWRVYISDGNALSSTATEWPVPVAAYARGFYSTELSGFWGLADLDADGRIELVVSRDPVTNEAWDDGTGPHWRVYENVGAGFSSTYTKWELPVPTAGPSFKAMAQPSSSEGSWGLADLDGDGRQDLVHTAPPGTPLKTFALETDPHWLVYFNDGQGFEAAPTQWRLPDANWSRGFFLLTDTRWPLVDIDGNGTLELVEVMDMTSFLVFFDGAQPVWRVHEATADGYTGPVRNWPVPTSGVPGGFKYYASARDNLYWTTLDIDADGKLDLVHTANHDLVTPAVWGSPDADHWKVYLGTGSGFSAQATTWAVPDSGLADGFYGTDVGVESRSWITADLEGDGVVELIQTADPGEPSGRVWGEVDGDPHWRIYRASPASSQ